MHNTSQKFTLKRSFCFVALHCLFSYNHIQNVVQVKLPKITITLCKGLLFCSYLISEFFRNYFVKIGQTIAENMDSTNNQNFKTFLRNSTS